jgi:N utilization substance protein A
MEFKYKDMIKALGAVEEDKNVSEQVVLDALKQAIEKAFKKDAELDDLDVTAEINEKKKTIDLYQNYKVVEDVEDDELEISLDDAKEINPNVELDGTVRRQVEVNGFSRAAISVAKNVMRQSITEAAKSAIYNEYIDKLDEMVIGIVEVVKDKFALINLGKTTAMMPSSAQIPNEVLHEGQQIRVVITEVNKGNKEVAPDAQDPRSPKNKARKGSQVVVSRADKMLVKRLFEREVPEIFNGTVEIKAIAREAGERTKMAVISHNPDIDPIGACIGPRGSRVQEIIEELHGEKVDIFKYSDDLTELVKNALAPAEIEAVLPGDDERSLRVIVDESQLSLAIGKKGKNARLAHTLTGYNIDIKTRKELEESGLDYDALVAEGEVKRDEIRKKNEAVEEERKAVAAKEEENKRIEAAQKLKEQTPKPELEEDGFIPEEMQDALSEDIRTKIDNEDTAAEDKKEETAENQTAEETVETGRDESTEEKEPETEKEEKPVESSKPAKAEKTKEEHHHADLEEMAANNKYVSRFEKLASAPKTRQQPEFRPKRKKKSDEDNYKLSNKKLAEQLKDKIVKAPDTDKPVYSEAELAEIEAQKQKDEANEFDIDYDEYEDYYDKDSK